MASFSIVFVFPDRPPGFSGHSSPPPLTTGLFFLLASPLGFVGLPHHSRFGFISTDLFRSVFICCHAFTLKSSICYFEVVFVTLVTLCNKYEAFHYLCLFSFYSSLVPHYFLSLGSPSSSASCSSRQLRVRLVITPMIIPSSFPKIVVMPDVVFPLLFQHGSTSTFQALKR